MTLAERFSRGVVWNSIGLATASVLGMAGSIVIARILGVTQFGIYSVVIATGALIAMLSSLGMEFALNRFVPGYRASGEPWKIRTLLKRLARVRFVLMLTAAVVLFAVSSPLSSSLLKDEGLAVYFRVLSLVIVGGGMNTLLLSFLQSVYDQRFLNLFTMATSSVTFILNVSLLLAGFGIIGLLGVSLLVNTLSPCMLAFRARDRLRRERETRTVADDREIDIARVLRYSFVMFLYSFMGLVLGKELDIVLLGHFSGAGQVAYYNIAYSFVFYALVLATIGFSGGISLTAISDLHSEGNFQGLRKAYGLLLEFVYILVLPVCIGGAVLGEDLIRLLFSDMYLPAAPLIVLFFVMMAFIKLGSITATFLSAMDRERKLLGSRTILGVTNVGLNIVLIPMYGAFGAIVGTVIAGTAAVLYESVLVHRLIRPSYPKSFIARCLTASLVMGYFVYAFREAFSPVLSAAGLLVSVPVFLLVGGAVYLLMLKVLKPVSRTSLEAISGVGIPLKRLILWVIR